MNPLRPHSAVIKEIRPETPDVKTYSIQVGSGFRSPNPGQFNMLGYPGTGEAPLSFSGLGTDGVIEHTIRSVGMVTGFMAGLTEGSEIFVRGPYGNGWPVVSAGGMDLLLIAGGVGLAPLRPVVLDIVNRRDSFGDAALLYGSRNEESLLFTGEYENWKRYLPVHLTIDEVTTDRPWPHHVGLITELLDRAALGGKTLAFLCGPELMMRFTARNLILKGLPPSRIYVSLERRMKCGIAHCGHCQHVGYFVCRDGPVFPYSKVMGLFDGML